MCLIPVRRGSLYLLSDISFHERFVLPVCSCAGFWRHTPLSSRSRLRLNPASSVSTGPPPQRGLDLARIAFWYPARGGRRCGHGRTAGRRRDACLPRAGFLSVARRQDLSASALLWRRRRDNALFKVRVWGTGSQGAKRALPVFLIFWLGYSIKYSGYDRISERKNTFWCPPMARHLSSQYCWRREIWHTGCYSNLYFRYCYLVSVVPILAKETEVFPKSLKYR